MFCCLPFLYKPKGVAVLSPVEVNTPAPQPLVIKKPIYEKPEDPSLVIDVPQVLRIRQVRIPDALMNIRNPSIKAQFKEFCKENTLCVACSYANPENPTVLVFNGILHECPHCDSDEDSP